MNIINNGRFIKIIADEGKRITNKERSFFTEYLYLAKNDSPENYQEVGKEIWGVFEKDESIETIMETDERQDFAIDSTMIALMDQIDTSMQQDNAIDSTIIALSEVIDMLFLITEEIVNEQLANTRAYKISPISSIINKYKGDDTMVEFYVVAIQRGLRTIDQVPARYREDVQKMLDQLEK